MFTGLIQAVGTVRRVTRSKAGLRLVISAPLARLPAGESIAVDGACLTVTRAGRGWFAVHVVDTTLDRTRLGDLRAGDGVNLERALRLGDRLGGHLVQGHVDGIGTVRTVTRRKDAVVIDLKVPVDVARVSVPLGSITVDGVSLTVVAKPARNTARVSLIPFTLQHTTLGRLRAGSRVHVEGDVIGKYVTELVRVKRQAVSRRGIQRDGQP